VDEEDNAYQCDATGLEVQLDEAQVVVSQTWVSTGRPATGWIPLWKHLSHLHNRKTNGSICVCRNAWVSVKSLEHMVKYKTGWLLKNAQIRFFEFTTIRCTNRIIQQIQ
jgi:hypothetical protein